MEDDNIIPYETSPSLTVKQAVMYILGYRDDYHYMADTEPMDFNLFDYLHNLQEEAVSAASNASNDLVILKQDGNATPEEMQTAEQKVESTKAELERANKLPGLADNYRRLINYEISRVRLGKHSPLVIDEDESSTGPLRINTASFQEWLEGIELDDTDDVSAPRVLPVAEDAFCQELSSKSAESLHITLGLLISMYAETRDDKFGSGQNPNVSNIAREISKYANERNGDFPLEGKAPSASRIVSKPH